MTGAEILREAASLMRRDGRHKFYVAVADWLDAEADEIPPGATHYREGLISEAPAFRVAYAYLG